MPSKREWRYLSANRRPLLGKWANESRAFVNAKKKRRKRKR